MREKEEEALSNRKREASNCLRFSPPENQLHCSAGKARCCSMKREARLVCTCSVKDKETTALFVPEGPAPSAATKTTRRRRICFVAAFAAVVVALAAPPLLQLLAPTP